MHSNLTSAAVHFYQKPSYVLTRAVVAGTVAVVGLPLNALMIIITRSHEKPMSAQSHLVLNLSLNNLVFSGYIMPVYVYDLVAGFDNQWGIYCRIQGFLFIYVQCNVILAYLHISLHRYFTIVFPGSTRLGYTSTKKTCIAVISQNLLLFCIMAPGLFDLWGHFGHSPSSGVCSILAGNHGGDSSYNLFGQVLATVCPVLVMTYCYGHILLTVKRQQWRMKTYHISQQQQQPGHSQTEALSNRKHWMRTRSRELHVTFTSVATVTVFAASFVPFMISQQVRSLVDAVVVQAVTGALAYIHALTDPAIYALADTRLRKHLLKMARQCISGHVTRGCRPAGRGHSACDADPDVIVRVETIA